MGFEMEHVKTKEGKAKLKKTKKKCPECKSCLFLITRGLYWCKKCDQLFDEEQLEK